MISESLKLLDWIILIGYFVVLIAIGLWASRKSGDGQGKFLASRSLKWYHIGFSMWGTNVGPSMLIASASAGFTTGIVSGNYAG
ncbi:MAG: Na+/glucose cotransporter, partial [Prevotella sp.]|nr:Na+/glucose cotransporter [Prevotella sp.]